MLGQLRHLLRVAFRMSSLCLLNTLLVYYCMAASFAACVLLLASCVGFPVSTLYWNIKVSSEVMVFFIYSGSSSNSRKSEQIYWWMSFWSGFKVFGTNFAQTLFMFNSSCKIFLIVSLLAFTVSAFIRMLIQWSPHRISLILVTVCGVETGWPGCGSSSVLSQLAENRLYHLKKGTQDGEFSL